MFRKNLILFALPAFLAGCATLDVAPAPSAPSAIASGALVSSADPRASEAGAAILRQGGSATDAAIAVMLALTVVEPQSSGIGGGGFYLRATPAGAVEALDGRETAPAEAGPDWFTGPDGKPLPFPQAVLSGLSIGVPGNIRLAQEAHRRHGRLPWADLFAPAIALARDGFALSPRLRDFLVEAKDRAAHDPDGAALFYGADGSPLPVGTRIANPALADTLAHLAATGAAGFYEGQRAVELAEQVRAYTPGSRGMTPADLASYRAVWRDAPCGTYRAYLICGMGPPSSGATTVYAILKQLERFDLRALGPRSATSWHLFAESQRLAYADRELFLADGDFVAVPVDGLMDGEYLAVRGALISADSRMPTVSAGLPDGANAALADGAEAVESGTSHFVIVDSEGNVVSWTSTIEGPFGSGLVVGGFYLNNELTDFSFVPRRDGMAVANRVQGGKRPRSSMAPTIVFGPDGRLVMAVGAAGGATIPVQVAKALIGVIDWQLPIDRAIALPILFSPDKTILVEEESSLLALAPALEELGHTVTARSLPLKANGALVVDGRWTGAADVRSEGAVVHP